MAAGSRYEHALPPDGPVSQAAMHVVSALLIAGQRPIGKRGINNPEPLANLSGCTGTVPLDVGIRENPL